LQRVALIPGTNRGSVHAKRGSSREEISHTRSVRSLLQALNSLIQRRSTAGDTFSDRDLRVFLSAK